MKQTNKLKLLVTGFEAFYSYTRNPAGEIAQTVNGRNLNDVQVTGISIPVSWDDAFELINEKVISIRPDALMMLGIMPEPWIRLETTAKNEVFPYLDIHDNKPPDFPRYSINPHKTAPYKTTLPIEWLKSEIDFIHSIEKIKGAFPKYLEAKYSNDAGRFLCNYTFFMASHFFMDIIPFQGFIHIPGYSPKGNYGGFSDKIIFNSGLLIVEKMTEWLRENHDNHKSS